MLGFIAAVIVSTGAINPACTVNDVCPKEDLVQKRPSDSYTNALKAKQIKERGLDASKVYEEDHFIPITLCGCPACPENLWPQPWDEARRKDKDEVRFHRDVCAGVMTLEQAQENIKTLWRIHD